MTNSMATIDPEISDALPACGALGKPTMRPAQQHAASHGNEMNFDP